MDTSPHESFPSLDTTSVTSFLAPKNPSETIATWPSRHEDVNGFLARDNRGAPRRSRRSHGGLELMGPS